MTAKDEAKATDGAEAEAPDEGGGKRKGRRLLLIAGVPLVLAAAGGGLWASGLLTGLLGGGSANDGANAGGDGANGAGQASAGAAPPRPAPPPVFLDMPEIVANLNTGTRRAGFIRLRSKLELARAEDTAAVHAAMPRLLDLFTTYLREIRPEELRGSAGTWRLREELLARANVAVAPARVTDVLFLEILQQ